MGMYSYDQSRINRMTEEELDRHTTVMRILLFLMGFGSWGMTWIVLYLSYEDKLYDSK